jgi:hypothetical protein
VTHPLSTARALHRTPVAAALRDFDALRTADERRREAERRDPPEREVTVECEVCGRSHVVDESDNVPTSADEDQVYVRCGPCALEAHRRALCGGKP